MIPRVLVVASTPALPRADVACICIRFLKLPKPSKTSQAIQRVGSSIASATGPIVKPRGSSLMLSKSTNQDPFLDHHTFGGVRSRRPGFRRVNRYVPKSSLYSECCAAPATKATRLPFSSRFWGKSHPPPPLDYRVVRNTTQCPIL